ncbi:MAG: ChbG/HpnK family deacetylase [bacterium]
MGKEILFIADDFGLSEEINAAILCCHQQGALHGASLMMGQCGTGDAVAMARQCASLRVGLHFHWNDSLPMTVGEWPWGASPIRAGWAIGVFAHARRLALEEMKAQWQAFQATGLRCDFINSHHHLHLHPMIFPELLKLVRGRFDGWIRAGTPRFFGWIPAFAGMTRRGGDIFSRAALGMIARRARRKCSFRVSDTLWGVDRLFCMNAEEVQQTAERLPDGLHEFIFHPRKMKDDADAACLMRLRALVREGKI